MAIDKDFIVKNGLVVLAQGSVESTGTTTGAIVTPGGIGIGGSDGNFDFGFGSKYHF